MRSGSNLFSLFYFFFFVKEGSQVLLPIKSEMAHIAIADWLLNKRYYLRAPLVIYKHPNKASREAVVQFTRMQMKSSTMTAPRS